MTAEATAPAADGFAAHWRARLGFLDLHYHAAPDAYRRRHGPIAAGRRYQALGGGVVLKSHLGDTAALASAAQAEGLPVFGSVVLNAAAGGLDFRVVRRSLAHCQFADSGRLLVHLPTVTGANHRSRLARITANRHVEAIGFEPLTIAEDDGNRLRPAVLDILRMAADEPLAISSGHASRSEVMLLIDAAARLGVPRLMLNQPANPMTGLDAAALRGLGAPDWLFIEQTALTLVLGYQSWEDFAEVLATLPNVVYSSDFGQTSQMDVADWRRTTEDWFDRLALPAERRTAISRDNPLRLLAP